MPADSNSTLAYQQLHPDEIIGAVESVGLVCDGRLLALNSYENRVYRVGLEDDSPVIAKFYRPGRWSDAAILEEHAFARELADDEVPVVAPVAYAEQTLFLHHRFRFAIYPCHPGRAPELDNLALLRQLGRLIARLHLRGSQAEFHHRLELEVSSYGEASRDYLLQAGFIPADLEPVYQSVCEDLFRRIDDCYGRSDGHQVLRIHGDFHPGNVLIQGDQLHIVDLDDACRGPAIQDLWMFLSGDRTEQTPQLTQLLEGYQEFRAFNPYELNILEALRTLRIMHYAAWLARRWQDPAFQIAFPWFNTHRYWNEHILSLREQAALLEEEPLQWNPA